MLDSRAGRLSTLEQPRLSIFEEQDINSLLPPLIQRGLLPCSLVFMKRERAGDVERRE